jgi:hypothetical protein
MTGSRYETHSVCKIVINRIKFDVGCDTMFISVGETVHIPEVGSLHGHCERLISQNIVFCLEVFVGQVFKIA